MGQDRVSASPSSAAVLPMHSHPGGDALTPTASAAAASASTNPRILLLPHPPLNPHTVGQAALRLPIGGSFRALQKGADIGNARPLSACRGESAMRTSVRSNGMGRLPDQAAILRKRLLWVFFGRKAAQERHTSIGPSRLRLAVDRAGKDVGGEWHETVRTP